MRACTLTITSGTDGKEDTFSRSGEMQLSPLKAELFYKEEEGEVRILLEGERVEIRRTGGYSLRLCLEKGKEREGYIGIDGQEGEIQTFTDKIAYSIREDSLLLSLRYYLLIGDEKQEMKIRLLARSKGERR